LGVGGYGGLVRIGKVSKKYPSDEVGGLDGIG